jgi:hypothetical protein
MSDFGVTRKSLDPNGVLNDVSDDDFAVIAHEHPEYLHQAAPAPQANRNDLLGKSTLNEPISPAPGGPLGIGIGIGVAEDVAKQGGLPYLANMPGRALQGMGGMLSGVGQALGAGVEGVAQVARLAPPNPAFPNAFYDPGRGVLEMLQAGRAIGRALPMAAHDIVKNIREEVTNPGAAFIRRPTETALDAGLALDSPSAISSLVSRAAAKFGATTIAKKAMAFSEATSPAARNAAIYQTLKTDSNFGPWVVEQEQIHHARDLVANRFKERALKDEGVPASIAQVVGKLDAAELDHLPGVVQGTSPWPTGARPEFIDAVKAYQQLIAERQAGELARGTLTPEIIDRRAHQPLRIETGGPEQLTFEGAPRRVNDVTGTEKSARTAEKMRDAALVKAAKGAEKEAAAARLKAQLAQSRTETRAATTAEKRAARFAGRSEQAQKGLSPLEGLDPNDPNRARMAAQATDVTKAELGLEGANLEAEASRAAIPGAPTTIAQNLGKTRQQARDAAWWQRHADALDRRATRLTALADAKRGRIPALDRLDAQTAAVKAARAPGPFASAYPKEFEDFQRSTLSEAEQWSGLHDRAGETVLKALGPGTIVDDATLEGMKASLIDEVRLHHEPPTYFPIQPTNKATGWDRLKPVEFRANKPGALQRSTGRTYATGEYERNPTKVLTRHLRASNQSDMNIGILHDISQNPYLSRPVENMRDFDPIHNSGGIDYTKESLLAPGAYARTIDPQISAVDAAFKSPNVSEALDKAARAVIVGDAENAANIGEAMGPFYAVPKHVASELHGQMGGWYDAFPRAAKVAGRLVFDSPNQFLRITALTLRPGFYVNNLVGNVPMALLAGASPGSLLSGEAVPVAARGTGFAATEMVHPPSGFGPIRKIAGLPNLANEGIDEWSRAGAFRGNVNRIASRKALLETGKRMDKAMSLAEKMGFIGPDGVDKAASQVSQFLNDYANQAPWQRNAARAVMPFQSFLVHMTKFVGRLPVTHPLRAQLLAQLANLGNDFQTAEFQESGINPADVKSYRLGQLPVYTDAQGNVTTAGTAGFNPFSGMGTNSAEMQIEPSSGALLESAVGSLTPGFQYARQFAEGKNGLGRPFSQEGYSYDYGSDTPRDAAGMPAGKRRPSPIDYIRQNTYLSKAAESIIQPNEAYDLASGFNPIPAAKQPETPRKYGAREIASGAAGLPYRTFAPSDLAISTKEKQARARIAATNSAEVVELNEQIKTATELQKATKDPAEYRKLQQWIKSYQTKIKAIKSAASRKAKDE